MMRSLFSGVSGLKNHQVRMDVIGNNISNVNTTGFKSERVTFQDIISQTVQGASGPKENKGGTNPQQIGLGVKIASIDKMMTQGSLQTTNKNTDLAITGEGFFALKDGDNKYYTRAGNFDVDKTGLLVNPSNGMKVQGWTGRPSDFGKNEIITSEEVQDITIPLYSKQQARETSFVQFKSNLNSAVNSVPQDATPKEIYRMITNPDPRMRRGHITSMKVFDDQGMERELNLQLWKVDTNTWNAKVAISGSESLSVDVIGNNGFNSQKAENDIFTIQFTPDGKISSVSDGIDEMNNGSLKADINFRIPGNPELKSIELRLGDANTVSGVTQFSSPFTTKAVEQDGHTMGYLESFLINQSGTIIGTYSNGVQQNLAQIALANFTNAEGLTKAGQSNFMQSINSGEALMGEAGIGGLGSMNAGFLEMSNVDLADSFTNMIVTQRGFQANSRSITTSDQMLQELLSLKR